jgi:Zn-dependent M28 family amino/carboxypeptidase
MNAAPKSRDKLAKYRKILGGSVLAALLLGKSCKNQKKLTVNVLKIHLTLESRENYHMKMSYPARLFAGSLLILSLLTQSFAQTAAPALSNEETQFLSQLTIESIKTTTAALSAPEMEGRGTMQPGGDKAAQYIADRFIKLDMEPLGDKGSFLQKVNFKETVLTPETSFTVGAESLKLGSDYAFVPLPFEKVSKNAKGELVFIAYGIQSSSINRDDLAGIDVRGKVVVMMDGPPASISKEAWNNANASLTIMSGLIRAGVAGVISIAHGREKEPLEVGIDYLSRRQIAMEGESDQAEPVPLPPFLLAGGAAAEKLFAKSGITLAEARARAERNDFKPFKLNQEAKIVAKYKSTKGSASNVAGVIRGSDPKLKEEAILFSAHYDAYGTDKGKIFPGAADNALGVAEMIAVAEAFAKLPQKPKRSLVFLAVTGEEYGLYGSKYWAKKPTWDIKKVAANLNLDGVGTEVYAPVKTIVGYGAEHSSLGPLMDQVASALGAGTIPDPFPEEKIFYRSDHFSFVERGVPSLMLLGAPAGDKEIWIKRMKDWEKTDYHQPGDVIKADWNWSGAKTVADVMAIMGLRTANAEKMPEWLPTSRFAKLERGNDKKLPEEK